MMPCTGALLCGGKSSRMGSDKALLQVNGQPLWRLQFEKLRAVCRDVLVCGSASQEKIFASAEVRFEADAAVELGPLSGIARALESARTGHVLVLAVDMPRMSEGYLLLLQAAAGTSWGTVPCGTGGFEGLCAVYPVSLLPVVLGLLSGGDRSLRALIRAGLEQDQLRAMPIADSDSRLFENWNHPGDISPEVELSASMRT